MSIAKQAICPHCRTGNELRLPGLPITCKNCAKVFFAREPEAPSSTSFQIQPPPPPVIAPVVTQRSASPPFAGVRAVPRQPHTASNKSRKRSWAKYEMLILGVIGVGLGVIVGYFAAHHFAFFGGFALLGEPYSPARNSLVPGHMLLCAILLGGAGVLIGFIRNRP